MLKERTELAALVELQTLFTELQGRLDRASGGSPSVLHLEETCRMWKVVWTKSEGRDAIQQKLQMLHRQI